MRTALPVRPGIRRSLPCHRRDVLRRADAGGRCLQRAHVRRHTRARRPNACPFDWAVAVHSGPSAAHRRHSTATGCLVRRRLDPVGRLRFLRCLRCWHASSCTTSGHHQSNRKSTSLLNVPSPGRLFAPMMRFWTNTVLTAPVPSALNGDRSPTVSAAVDFVRNAVKNKPCKSIPGYKTTEPFERSMFIVDFQSVNINFEI